MKKREIGMRWKGMKIGNLVNAAILLGGSLLIGSWFTLVDRFFGQYPEGQYPEGWKIIISLGIPYLLLIIWILRLTAFQVLAGCSIASLLICVSNNMRLALWVVATLIAFTIMVGTLNFLDQRRGDRFGRRRIS